MALHYLLEDVSGEPSIAKGVVSLRVEHLKEIGNFVARGWREPKSGFLTEQLENLDQLLRVVVGEVEVFVAFDRRPGLDDKNVFILSV